MKVANVTITENKRVCIMLINCKKCGKDVGNYVTQRWINELILNGKTYTHSDGTQAEYKEISKLCECNTK